MKKLINLVYKDNGMMINIAFYSGLMYNDYKNDMLFVIREEIADKRTGDFLGDLLCRIFETTYSDIQYKAPETIPDDWYQIGIYDILFAFIDHIRRNTDEKHYKENLRKVFKTMKIDMKENLPAIHLLKDNTYTLTPVEPVKYGYEFRMVKAAYKLNGKTKKQLSVRDKKRRAVYRNFNWNNLYESCYLYRTFVNCDVYGISDLNFIARGMCSVEKGKNKFLEIIESTPKHRSMYSNIHWKEILTAIIKDDVPIPSCEQCYYCDECNHADNMILTAKPKKCEIRVLRQENYTDIDTAYQELQNAFQRAVNSDENKIFIIKGQTALGKTSTYIDYMKSSKKSLIIAVPTHELKNQIIEDAESSGILNICSTPDIRTYGISEEIIEEMQELYRIGAGMYALRLLALKLNEIAKDNTDYDKISRYLNDCRKSSDFDGHIITTHAKLLHIPESALKTHDVIIDEDILRTVLHTESISRQKIKSIQKSRVFPYEINNHLAQICRYQGCYCTDSIDLLSDEAYLEKLKETDSNIYGLLNSNCINVDKETVTFLVEEKLPDSKIIIMSATINYELYKKIYRDREIDYYECPKVRYKGRVIQYTDSSYSRYALTENESKLQLLNRRHFTHEVITFKEIENQFDTHYHFGNVEGINCLQGKDIAVIGLPNLHESVYFLYAVRAGEPVHKAFMYPHRIKYNNKTFTLNTYKNETLQMIQCWILSSQLEQAVGRARLLRENCIVYVYAGFPVEQAEYIDKLVAD
ncbi:MAG: hypothetical protein ACI4JM_06855 [Oscillospiraceae bacterium]